MEVCRVYQLPQPKPGALLQFPSPCGESDGLQRLRSIMVSMMSLAATAHSSFHPLAGRVMDCKTVAEDVYSDIQRQLRSFHPLAGRVMDCKRNSVLVTPPDFRVKHSFHPLAGR